MKTSKFAFEINWPLEAIQDYLCRSGIPIYKKKNYECRYKLKFPQLRALTKLDTKLKPIKNQTTEKKIKEIDFLNHFFLKNQT